MYFIRERLLDELQVWQSRACTEKRSEARLYDPEEAFLIPPTTAAAAAASSAGSHFSCEDLRNPESSRRPRADPLTATDTTGQRILEKPVFIIYR